MLGITIRMPETQQEWDNYFHLRWEILRKPWGKALGTEQDDCEHNSIHAMALFDGKIIGVGRLNLLENNVAQIRFMAVNKSSQKAGTGSAILHYLEDKAIEHKCLKICLHARELAVQFYAKNNYIKIEKTFLLYDTIQHYLMEKKL